ncbi:MULTISPECIES: protein phosphatase 2C domain-containing protein [Bacteria]|jgi:serine/threonine protein phosphatase PrpC|uniref:protein phosphatase 2C domain-containing protein n=1 Tax=uncultured Psychrobacter sp. TaxID=259303 RepID=UPI001040A2C8|tara:strand:- start:3314 stop:4030 length:717 start_codon:yes stop_codon:yes gene_type:complete
MNPLYFTAKGPRSSNEDSYLIQPLERGMLLIVADGLGGHKGGKYASHYATINFLERLQSIDDIGIRPLENILKKIHEELINLGLENNELYGMGTTLTCAYIDSENKLLGVHTGDSRAYLLRGNGLIQLTTDHTEAQKLFDEGLISKDEFLNYPRKNILVSALGAKSNRLLVDSFEYQLQAKDRLLLSSDGFYASITKKEIRDVSVKFDEFSEFFFDVLSYVRQTEPTDNYSVVGIQVD